MSKPEKLSWTTGVLGGLASVATITGVIVGMVRSKAETKPAQPSTSNKPAVSAPVAPAHTGSSKMDPKGTANWIKEHFSLRRHHELPVQAPTDIKSIAPK